MPTIFDLLYREYCRARLAEMRKQLLIPRAESQEVPEANCDARHPAIRNAVSQWFRRLAMRSRREPISTRSLT
jgi:hypothetical protein